MSRGQEIVEAVINFFQGVLCGAIENGMSLEQIDGVLHRKDLRDTIMECIRDSVG